MAPPSSRLTRLQVEILAAFFERDQRFYLTGGAALAGYHLGHRETHDLDLFTLTPAMEDGLRALRDAARSLHASLEEVQTAPEFRRLLVSRGGEAVVVDLVVEHAEQIHADKPAHGLVRVDPADEIFANKLCALLGRSEVRDLVDVRALERLGLSLEKALAAAGKKDGGLTPGQLAWVLSQITIAEEAVLPGGVTPVELREYLSRLIDELARLAHP
jgi:predicted nucleotidyltransferase component of viral defense system